MNKFNYSQTDLPFFLRGKRGTEIPCIHADLPTDPIKVIDFIKVDFINNPSFRKSIIDNIILMSYDIKFSWFSVYYLYSIIRLDKTNELGINIEKLILEIEKGIEKNEKELKDLNIWVGANYENGLWGDVERMAKNIYEEFGYKIYPFES